MSHSRGTVGNADKWTAVFKDASGIPVDPDSDVTWTVYDDRNEPIPDAGATQTLGQKTAIGTFEFTYPPTAFGAYRVKASATVGGVPQATEAVRREVVR